MLSSPHSRLPQSRAAANLAFGIALAMILAGLTILWHRHFYLRASPLFWDLPVYTAAVDSLSRGEDPYDSAALHRGSLPTFLQFTSPPFVVYLLSGIAALGLGRLLGPALTILHLISIIGIPMILSRMLLGQAMIDNATGLGAFLLLLASAGVGAIGACNNGTALYFFILLALQPGLDRGDWRWFYAAVLAASLFKPFYLAFLIAPVFLDGMSVARLRSAAGCVMLSCGAYLLVFVADPGNSRRWLSNLAAQTLGQRDTGLHVFTYVRNTWPDAPGWLPLAAFLCFGLAMLALIWRGQQDRQTRLAALLTAAIFANPRILVYDTSVAAIPLLLLSCRAVAIPSDNKTGVALVAAALAAVTTGMTYRTVHLLNPELLFPALALIVIALASRPNRTPVVTS